ncbi:hypothetical protein [Cronobacter phage vB_Cdu_VP8]|nr:hypothetical protein [Cronobacter phage vB_Cdu_VP8]
MQKCKLTVGETVVVVHGKYKDVVGTLKSINKRTRVIGHKDRPSKVERYYAEVVIETKDGKIIAPQYKFVEPMHSQFAPKRDDVQIKGTIAGYKRGDLVKAQEEFEGKWVKPMSGPAKFVRCLVTLVYRQGDVIMANCVHQGTYHAVKVSDLAVYTNQNRCCSLV